MLSLFEDVMLIVLFFVLYIVFLLVAVFVSATFAKKWVWSDKTFTRLLYWLLVGSLYALLVL